MATIDQILLKIQNLDEESLEILTRFYANQPFEEDLEKDFLSWKSLILWKTQKNDEALLVVEQLLSLINQSDHRYGNATITKVNLLIILSGLEEAERIIVTFLSDDQHNTFQKLAILSLLVNVYDQKKRIVPVSYQPIVKKISSGLGIDFREEKNLRLEIDRILSASAKSNRLFSELVLKIEDLSITEKKENIKDFVDSEKVGYYKKAAIEILRSL